MTSNPPNRTTYKSITMKLSAVLVAVFATSAAAFAPSKMERASTVLNMDRRSVFKQVGLAAAGVVAAAPFVANADGAVSAATILKAQKVYGSRIANLAGAVAAGDFSAVAEEKNAFILFNSGAYPTAKAKADKAAAVEGTNAIFAAIRSQDKAALKSAYDSYVAANDITPFPAVDPNKGQSYSSDYSYLVKTDGAAVYVR